MLHFFSLPDLASKPRHLDMQHRCWWQPSALGLSPAVPGPASLKLVSHQRVHLLKAAPLTWGAALPSALLDLGSVPRGLDM